MLTFVVCILLPSLLEFAAQLILERLDGFPRHIHVGFENLEQVLVGHEQ